MKRLFNYVSVLALLFPLAACDSNGNNGNNTGGNFEIADILGNYNGLVTATIMRPGAEPQDVLGEGSITIRIRDDSTLGLSLDIDDNIDLGSFDAQDGSYDSKGAYFTWGSFPCERAGNFNINGEGGLSGEVFPQLYISLENEFHELCGDFGVSGQIVDNDFDMTWDGEVVEGDNEIPAGSELRVVWNLRWVDFP